MTNHVTGMVFLSKTGFCERTPAWRGIEYKTKNILINYQIKRNFFMVRARQVTPESLSKLEEEYQDIRKKRPNCAVYLKAKYPYKSKLKDRVAFYHLFANHVRDLVCSRHYYNCFFASLLRYSKLTRLELDPDLFLLLSDELKLMKAIRYLSNLFVYKTSEFFSVSLRSRNYRSSINWFFDIIVSDKLFLPFLPFEPKYFFGKRFIIASGSFANPFFRRILFSAIVRDNDALDGALDKDLRLKLFPLHSLVVRDKDVSRYPNVSRGHYDTKRFSEDSNWKGPGSSGGFAYTDSNGNRHGRLYS